MSHNGYMRVFKNNKGFSLTELSITIVVIGIIAAGIVSGQTMIKSSKIQAQISDFRKYESAYKSFKEQFNAMPGDFNRASDFFGGAVPNGDGNFIINGGLDNVMPPSEVLLFFHHLSLERMVPENFEMVFKLDVGYPHLKLDRTKGMTAGGHFGNFGSTANYGYQVTGTPDYKALLNLQAGQAHLHGPGNYPRRQFNNFEGTATADTYYLIDKKIDDGRAREGRFKAYRAWSAHYPYRGDCLTGINGDYLLGSDIPLCHAYYIFEE